MSVIDILSPETAADPNPTWGVPAYRETRCTSTRAWTPTCCPPLRRRRARLQGPGLHLGQLLLAARAGARPHHPADGRPGARDPPRPGDPRLPGQRADPEVHPGHAAGSRRAHRRLQGRRHRRPGGPVHHPLPGQRHRHDAGPAHERPPPVPRLVLLDHRLPGQPDPGPGGHRGGPAHQGGAAGLPDADHRRAPGEPRRRPAVDALHHRDRRRHHDRPGHQGLREPADRGRRGDHRQGIGQHDLAAAGGPGADGRGARGPQPGRACVRRDAAALTAGADDHAAAVRGRGDRPGVSSPRGRRSSA